ncbi:ATP-binding protein [Streptomyces sp. CBMA29]|uniref:ATP-binding protein n=1 Tax=Streptomyces sp. CBMA29 TaxID=1896314 RepID=UPI0016620D07|nr:ATP-binding protein [Streptomyces sp. CBMA29]MBD0740426.1 hypothetical protein [Streptomyces sp. CBMA29]
MPSGFLVPADEAEVATARRKVVEVVRDWEMTQPDELLDDVALLTTEVVTNAIRHTRAACAVAVRWTGTRVRVEVTDVDPRRPSPREEAADAEDGRGLLLIASLSADWGCEEVPAGKVVWFEVEPPQAEPQAGQPAVHLRSFASSLMHASGIARLRQPFARPAVEGGRS